MFPLTCNAAHRRTTDMTRIHRRQFLTRSRNLGLGAAVGWTILRNSGSARGAPANEKVILGLIGEGGRGSNLATDFAARGDCHFACIADCDSGRFASLSNALAEKQGGQRRRARKTTAASWTASRSMR